MDEHRQFQSTNLSSSGQTMRSHLATIVFGVVLLVGSTGCMSEKAANELGRQLVTPFTALAEQICTASDLGYAIAAFNRKNDRWPKNYAELDAFVNSSNGFLTLRKYDQVDFVETPDGGLKVCAVINSHTNQFSFSGDQVQAKRVEK